MSNVTKYYCDICGEEKSSVELLKIKAEVIAYNGYLYGRDGYIGRMFYKDLCFPCAIKLDVLEKVNTNAPNDREPDTAEKLYNAIVEIVREHAIT